jgi:hypothetical protein
LSDDRAADDAILTSLISELSLAAPQKPIVLDALADGHFEAQLKAQGFTPARRLTRMALGAARFVLQNQRAVAAFELG